MSRSLVSLCEPGLSISVVSPVCDRYRRAWLWAWAWAWARADLDYGYGAIRVLASIGE